MGRVASHWHGLDGGTVQCELCPVGCRLEDGQDGLCGTRGNEDGRMVARQYGRLVSAGVDPIEKKPLFHFHPGARIFSIAAQGCNLHCQFCQNWSISQERSGRPTDVAPPQIVAKARGLHSCGVAYTYSEPLVWYEFVLDTARLARGEGLKNVIVSNGFLNQEPLREILPWIDAANIDLKSMEDAFYVKHCQARLEPVLATIRLCRELSVHLEVTNLIIPGYNDRDDQLQRLIDFVAELDPQIPVHFSAYHPAFKFTAPPTPPQTLLRAAALARGKLAYVYLGNTNLPGSSDTLCPGCGKAVIVRQGYHTENHLTADAACPDCRTQLPVVLA